MSQRRVVLDRHRDGSVATGMQSFGNEFEAEAVRVGLQIVIGTPRARSPRGSEMSHIDVTGPGHPCPAALPYPPPRGF